MAAALRRFLDSLFSFFLVVVKMKRFMNGMERTMRNVVMKAFIEDLYQKCVKNGIKLPADKMQATTELWNEAGGLMFDVEKSYDVRPLFFPFSEQSMSNLLLHLSGWALLDLATKVWVSQQKS
jgi:hypothetical protein